MKAAEETYVKLLYLHDLYNVAEKDGIDTTNFNEIVEYVKENKLIEEKQKNIIKFKIQRASCIMKLYNDSKYINIQDYIKRINFKTKDLAKLSHEQWLLFKKFLENNLDEELNNFENNNKNNNINNNSDINIEKLSKIIDKKYLYKSNKDDKLCIIQNCNNNKHNFNNILLEYCIKHINFDFIS